MANRSRSLSNKSTASSSACWNDVPDTEFFWCIELNAEKRSFSWTTREEVEQTDDDDKDDEDYVKHTIFVKQAVLASSAVAGEQNIVVFESKGHDEAMQNGIIVNLTRGLNPMAAVDVTVIGQTGGTFTLLEGSGPVILSGTYLLEFPDDDYMDLTRVEPNKEEVENVDETEEEEESDDKKSKDKKNSKRKAAAKGGIQKQKAKVDDDDDDENEDEEEDDSDDDDDYDFESEVKKKQAKKTKDSGKKVKRTAKMDKESSKKVTKKMKK